jgi:hypothetical protein
MIYRCGLALMRWMASSNQLRAWKSRNLCRAIKEGRV